MDADVQVSGPSSLGRVSFTPKSQVLALIRSWWNLNLQLLPGPFQPRPSAGLTGPVDNCPFAIALGAGGYLDKLGEACAPDFLDSSLPVTFSASFSTAASLCSSTVASSAFGEPRNF